MNITLVRCSVIGGLIVFIWGALSWMALPFHKDCFLRFENEYHVAEKIKENAPQDGMYILPNTMRADDNVRYKHITRAKRMLEDGPFMFASVRTNGLGKMSILPFIGSLLTQIAGAFFITWMMMQTKFHDFGRKVGFITLFGLAVGILSQIPDSNWWGFAWKYTIVNIFDFVIGWFLAGLAIAKFSKVK